MERLGYDCAQFLKQLELITDLQGPEPGKHSFFRGAHVSVYDQGAREQIEALADVIDATKALDLWDRACATVWDKAPVWVHGDFAVGNILITEGRLSAVIDFGNCSMGDPACDLVLAWTYLTGKAREVFVREFQRKGRTEVGQMAMDEGTWLRSRAWALWKATYELCKCQDKSGPEALLQRRIVDTCLDLN